MLPFSGMGSFWNSPPSFGVSPDIGGSNFSLLSDSTGPAKTSGGDFTSALGKASLAMSLGSMIGGFGASIINANLQQDVLEYQADIGRINARISENSAWAALEDGRKQEQRYMMELSKLRGQQSVAAATAGLDLSYGSVKDVEETTNMVADMDLATLRLNAGRQAFGLQMQSINQLREAQFAQTTAGGISPLLAGTSSLLGNAGQVAQNWYLMRRFGGVNQSSEGEG